MVLILKMVKMGSSLKVYEYVVVSEWLDDLEKGTRLYYDYDKQGYVYHYESSRTNKNDRYEVSSSTESDYFISVAIADKGITGGRLLPGPELGELVMETTKIVANGL